MCGITGLFYEHRNNDSNHLLNSAMHEIRHRGPDDSGLVKIEVNSGMLELGHTRLSIIDLSADGKQPMQSIDKRYVIVFNGEIYNYKELRTQLLKAGFEFKTKTDTEVLINCWSRWGVECLKKITGMFAFVLYDNIDNRLWVVRDAFGIKPIFYYYHEGYLAFASEISALKKLLPSTPKLNAQICYEYLAFGQYDHKSESFFDGINQLKPGSFFSLELTNLPAKILPVKWWWPEISESSNITFQDAVANVRELFLKNISLHLRSDVPLGAALSGGIDSSAIVCAMRKLNPDMPINTFSYVAKGSDYNEEKWIDIVNKHVQAIPNKIFFSSDDIVKDIEDLIRAQGEPFGSTSIYAQYLVFKKMKEVGVTVSLDGQGADELFVGYDGYPIPQLRTYIDNREYTKLYNYMRFWKSLNSSSNYVVAKYLRSAVINDSFRIFIDRYVRRPSINWMNFNVLNELNVELNRSVPLISTDGKGIRVKEFLREAVSNQPLPVLLRHGDRNSMRWSIESRVPFLTTDFADYLFSLPENFLTCDKAKTKKLLREAMRGIVPDIILDRKDKIGFKTPENVILKSIEPIIADSLYNLGKIPFIDVSKLEKEVNYSFDKGLKSKTRIWNIFNLSKFIEFQNIDKVDF